MKRAAIVVIGRNEGERLKRSLQNLPIDADRVYVDSGSVDGSAQYARDAGIATIELTTDKPFTAARARNAGVAHLWQSDPVPEFVQMLDGDCVLHPEWLAQGIAALDKDDRLAAVFGRLRERDIVGSIYNRLCDAEWNVRLGVVDSSGGNALFRSAALAEVGPYREDMIAGEEPDLCLRLARKEWRIARILPDMAEHDAAMSSIRQWWLRAVRAGHAYAEHVWLHQQSAFHSWKVQLLRIFFWGMLLPIALLASAAVAIASNKIVILILPAGLYILQFLRLVRRNRNDGYSMTDALKISGLNLLGKLAEALGVLKFMARKISRRTPRLIEYKSPAA